MITEHTYEIYVNILTGLASTGTVKVKSIILIKKTAAIHDVSSNDGLWSIRNLRKTYNSMVFSC